MSIKKLQRKHFRALLKAEADGDKALGPAWDACLAKLAAGLAKLPGDAPASDHRQAIEAALSAALDTLVRSATPALGKQATASIALGIRQGLDEIAFQEARWGDADTAEAIKAMEVEAPDASPIEAKSLYEPFKAVFEVLKERLFLDGMADALEGAIAAGENLKTATERLVGKIKGERWQLTRIARTEIGNAMNQGHAKAIGAVSGRYPAMGLMQQWSSFFDAVTSAICRVLHGQVRAPGQPFTGLGESHDRPPAKPNCRSRLVAWAPHWDDAVQPRTQAETDAAEAAWQAERQAEREALRQARRTGKKSALTPAVERSFDSFYSPGSACCSGHH